MENNAIMIQALPDESIEALQCYGSAINTLIKSDNNPPALLFAKLREGLFQYWVVFVNDNVQCSFITSIETSDTDKCYAIINYLAGKNVRSALSRLPEFEMWAEHNGASSIMVETKRPGLVKILQKYDFVVCGHDDEHDKTVLFKEIV